MAGYLKARWKSFGHAIAGLIYVVRAEPHARIHILAAVLVVTAGLAFDILRAEWLWLTLAIGLVWIFEVLNTAVEFLCDVVAPEHSQKVKRAKDIAAGSVLIAAIMAAIIGGFVFSPYILALI